jgi:hypothetical protein
MKKVFVAITLFLLNAGAVMPLLADVKIRQRVTFEGQSMEQTRMIKGARERAETKVGAADGQTGGFSMPQVARITQCDLRQTLSVNDAAKKYLVEPFPEDDPVASTPVAKTPAKTVRGGTVTIDVTVTDTRERKTIFGLTARHLIVTQAVESSADSCGGASRSRVEFDGWYADFSADFSCPTTAYEYRPEKPDCRDRLILKQNIAGRLGFLLEGTMKSFDAKGKVISSSTTETLEISRSPLAASFFEIGPDYREVGSLNELMGMPSMADFMKNSGGPEMNTPPTRDKTPGRKFLGLDFPTGDTSKINGDAIRAAMLEQLTAKGFAAGAVASPAEIAGGRFDFVIGVEIKQAKQSKAGKIGGLFGKVTGSTDAAKLGDSEAEVVVTVYQKDGKTVVAAQTAKQKIAGTPDDAVKAAVASALDSLSGKIK